VRVLNGHTGPIYCVAFNKDGTMLASAIILAAVLLVITAPHRDALQADESIPTPGEA
jgi:WD40 repeat protein